MKGRQLSLFGDEYPTLQKERPCDRVVPGYKRCSKCREVRTLSQFNYDRTRRDGRNPHCKVCRTQYRENNKAAISARKKAYREKNAEKIRQHKREYYVANKEKVLAGQRRHYVENREKVIEAAARYREANRAQVRATNRRYYWENRDACLAHFKKWREKNREYLRILNRNYRQTHREEKRAYERDYYRRKPHKERAKKHRRRARVREAEGSFTSEEWLLLCEMYGHRCLRCGEKVKLTPDHVIPLSLGGANSIDNIQPLCLPCNQIKGVNIIDYRQLPTVSDKETE